VAYGQRSRFDYHEIIESHIQAWIAGCSCEEADIAGEVIGI
jgi:hypothetical protein